MLQLLCHYNACLDPDTNDLNNVMQNTKGQKGVSNGEEGVSSPSIRELPSPSLVLITTPQLMDGSLYPLLKQSSLPSLL